MESGEGKSQAWQVLTNQGSSTAYRSQMVASSASTAVRIYERLFWRRSFAADAGPKQEQSALVEPRSWGENKRARATYLLPGIRARNSRKAFKPLVGPESSALIRAVVTIKLPSVGLSFSAASATTRASLRLEKVGLWLEKPKKKMSYSL